MRIDYLRGKSKVALRASAGRRTARLRLHRDRLPDPLHESGPVDTGQGESARHRANRCRYDPEEQMQRLRGLPRPQTNASLHHKPERRSNLRR